MDNKADKWTPEYLSVGFVAKRCGVSNTTVLRWINIGQIPAFRLPAGHYRIARKDFENFLTQNKMPVDVYPKTKKHQSSA